MRVGGNQYSSPLIISQYTQVSAVGETPSIRAHDRDINYVAISPNDSLVASGSQKNSSVARR